MKIKMTIKKFEQKTIFKFLIFNYQLLIVNTKK